MNNCRILFEKTGRAKYISHLDLMRTVTRGFIRAGIKIKHTEGFNPHPYMTFALPLSVCVESKCELVDFITLDNVPYDELTDRLNAVLPEGIIMLKAYEPVKKFKDIGWLKIHGILNFNGNTPDAGIFNDFFSKSEIIISKKTKRGMADTDIVPMIKELAFTNNGGMVEFDAVLAAQNPSLNPEHLITAIRTHIPEYAPASTSFTRLEVYASDYSVFR